MTEHQGAAAEHLLGALVTLRPSLHFDSLRLIEPKLARALETICAFANTDGGVLALGIEEFDRAWEQHRLFGVDENAHLRHTLQRLLDTHIAPPIEGIQFATLHGAMRDGALGRVVLVCVPPSAQVHALDHMGVPGRLASINRRLTPPEIDDLKYRRGVLSAECMPVNVPLAAIETVHWQRYCSAQGLALGDTAARLLQTGLGQRVADAAGERVLPTRAAVLLFAENPDALLAPLHVQAGLRILHFAEASRQHGEPALLRPPQRLTGPLSALIDQSCDAVLEALQAGFAGTRATRTRSAYPEEALRAAICNALLHRDYRYARDVEVRIDGRHVEIDSPGDLPGGISAATYAAAPPRPRNPQLVSALAAMRADHASADAPQGVKAMFDAMREAGLYPPQIAQRVTAGMPTVSISLLNERRAPEWDKTLAWIDRRGCIASRDLAQLAGLDSAQARQQLKRWVAMGLLQAEDLTDKPVTVYSKRVGPPPHSLDNFLKASEIRSAYSKKSERPKSPRRRIKLPELD